MLKKWYFQTAICTLILMGLFVCPALANDQDLAKASQNPVAAMISLPMKNKFNFGRGDEDAFAYELEMQPVYPVNLGKLNLINRFIIPNTYQEPAYEGMDHEFGLKDTTYQAGFSGSVKCRWICGCRLTETWKRLIAPRTGFRKSR